MVIKAKYGIAHKEWYYIVLDGIVLQMPLTSYIKLMKRLGTEDPLDLKIKEYLEKIQCV